MINIEVFIEESLTNFPHVSRSSAQWKELQEGAEETISALINQN
jgi:hypothetical protein